MNLTDIDEEFRIVIGVGLISEEVSDLYHGLAENLYLEFEGWDEYERAIHDCYKTLKESRKLALFVAGLIDKKKETSSE